MLSGRALRRAHQTAPAVADVPERTSFVKQRGVRLCGLQHGQVLDDYGSDRNNNVPAFRVRHVQAQARDEPGAGELEVTPASMGSVRTDAEGGVQREERTGWAFGTAFAYVDDVLVCSGYARRARGLGGRCHG